MRPPYFSAFQLEFFARDSFCAGAPYPKGTQDETLGVVSFRFVKRRDGLPRSLPTRTVNDNRYQVSNIRFRTTLGKGRHSNRQSTRLYPNATSNATQHRKGRPPRINTMATTRRRPYLRATRRTTTILRPIFANKRTTAIILRSRMRVLIIPNRPSLSLPTKTCNPRNIKGRVGRRLLNLLNVHLSVTTPRQTIVRNRSSTRLLLSLQNCLNNLRRSPTRICQLRKQLIIRLRFRRTRRFPRNTLRTSTLLPRVLRHLPNPFISNPNRVRLRMFPILIRSTRKIRRRTLGLFTKRVPRPTLFYRSILSLFSRHPTFHPYIPLSVGF